MSDQLDAFGLQIEELSTDIESQNEKINEDIGSLEEFDQMVASNLTDLAEQIENINDEMQFQIDFVK